MTDPIRNDADGLYRLLVQGVTDYAIYMLSPEGTVANWNAGAQRAKGYTADEIVGRNFSCFYLEEDRAAGLPQRGLATARATGRFEAEGWRVRKDGSRFWAHVVIDAIHDDDGVFIGFAKITRDCTERMELEAAARVQEQRFRLLVQGVTDYAIYMLTSEGTVANWNAGAQRAKGYTADEIVGRHSSIFYRDADRAAGQPQHDLETARTGGHFEAEGWRVRKDGSEFWAHVIIDAIHDEDGSFVGFATITRDRTEKRIAALKLQKAVDNLDLALSNISQGLCLVDPDRRLVLANAQLRAVLRIPAERSMPGMSLPAILNETLGREAATGFEAVHLAPYAEAAEPVTSEFRHGERVLSATTRALAEGGWVSTMVDVTRHRRIEETVRFLARHDPLTQLPNRATFLDLLERRLSDRLNPNLAVLYLDLDRFKPVNDTYGHAVGDALLKAVASRLEQTVRRSDVVARLGGDEFAVIVRTVMPDDAACVASRIVTLLGEPFKIDGVTVNIGCSIGIATAASSAGDADMILKNADLALYQAKREGRNRHRVYDAGLGASAAHRLCLEADLRRALANGAFVLHYQPIVRARSGRVVGYEALLRWNRDGRPVSPAEFIPVAEEAGLMPALGAWILERACREALRWPAGLTLSVNLSPTQLRHADLTEIVAATLETTGLPAARLEFEITETAILADKAQALDTLRRLRAMGTSIALDDFGTGYSSLSFVHELPITRIKIDRSFIRGLGTDPNSAAIVRAIVGLARNLGLAVTAEGIETATQLDFLRKARCPHLQGYLFGRPVPAEHLDPPGSGSASIERAVAGSVRAA